MFTGDTISEISCKQTSLHYDIRIRDYLQILFAPKNDNSSKQNIHTKQHIGGYSGYRLHQVIGGRCHYSEHYETT
ncbi:unnamed protein product [Allacma fusca]|uniref:Uncharacterized protein n=1 Tax=Allacma fusca TaxID=39272 RepID=A0A8J2MBL9_9HEXA|nr:unnamed protein product [Allacma fusca]